MLTEEFQKMFKEGIESIRSITHVGNNKIFRVRVSGKDYLIKKYTHREPFLTHDRGKTEFSALKFLWERGFREIPIPILFDDENGFGIYSFELGKSISPRNVRMKDISAACNFLIKLNKLPLEDRMLFGPACSAYFSIRDYIAGLNMRLNRLSILPYKKYSIRREGKDFLNERVIPEIERVTNEVMTRTSNIETNLPYERQVLSPSDFGFHNILLHQGRHTFIDFEYFGRDDPAKQILDFLHHDNSIEISMQLKSAFVEKYDSEMRIPEFKERIKLLDPLIGLTWVLIYLNVLSPEYTKNAGLNDNQVKERIRKAVKKMNYLTYFE